MQGPLDSLALPFSCALAAASPAAVKSGSLHPAHVCTGPRVQQSTAQQKMHLLDDAWPLTAV